MSYIKHFAPKKSDGVRVLILQPLRLNVRNGGLGMIKITSNILTLLLLR